MTVPRQIALASWTCFASACALAFVGSGFSVADALSPLIQLQVIGVLILGVWGIALSLRRGDALAGIASSVVVVALPHVVLALAATADWQ
jgi:hypothetical protein